MSTLSQLGLDVDLPDGWDGRIYNRQDEVGEIVHRALHAATFALPTGLADYATGAIRTMAQDDVLIVLQEFAGSAGTALFSGEGLPTLSPESFSPTAMPQVVPGRSGAQFFFSVNDRAFSLFVVIGSHNRRGTLAQLANAVVRTITVTA